MARYHERKRADVALNIQKQKERLTRLDEELVLTEQQVENLTPEVKP